MEEERKKYQSLSKDQLIELKQLVQQLQAQVSEIQRSKKLPSQKTRTKNPKKPGRKKVRSAHPIMRHYPTGPPVR
jgi:hypothetical protein